MCDPKVINSSIDSIDNTLNNELPITIARKVSYTTDTLNNVYVYGTEDSSQNVFQGLEFRTGTEAAKRYRFQQDSNGYITLYRRKSDDSGWEAVYSGNISLISALQSSLNSLKLTGDTSEIRFNSNTNTNGISIRYKLSNGNIYALRLFGAANTLYYEYSKLAQDDTTDEVYFTNRRLVFENISGGGTLYVYDRVCVLQYAGASYNSTGTPIATVYRPNELTWNFISSNGSDLPYRIGVRANGTVVVQRLDNTSITTAIELRGQVMWIRSHNSTS